MVRLTAFLFCSIGVHHSLTGVVATKTRITLRREGDLEEDRSDQEFDADQETLSERQAESEAPLGSLMGYQNSKIHIIPKEHGHSMSDSQEEKISYHRHDQSQQNRMDYANSKVHVRGNNKTNFSKKAPVYEDLHEETALMMNILSEAETLVPTIVNTIKKVRRELDTNATFSHRGDEIFVAGDIFGSKDKNSTQLTTAVHGDVHTKKMENPIREADGASSLLANSELENGEIQAFQSMLELMKIYIRDHPVSFYQSEAYQDSESQSDIFTDITQSPQFQEWMNKIADANENPQEIATPLGYIQKFVNDQNEMLQKRIDNVIRVDAENPRLHGDNHDEQAPNTSLVVVSGANNERQIVRHMQNDSQNVGWHANGTALVTSGSYIETETKNSLKKNSRNKILPLLAIQPFVNTNTAAILSRRQQMKEWNDVQILMSNDFEAKKKMETWQKCYKSQITGKEYCDGQWKEISPDKLKHLFPDVKQDWSRHFFGSEGGANELKRLKQFGEEAERKAVEMEANGNHLRTVFKDELKLSDKESTFVFNDMKAKNTKANVSAAADRQTLVRVVQEGRHAEAAGLDAVNKALAKFKEALASGNITRKQAEKLLDDAIKTLHDAEHHENVLTNEGKAYIANAKKELQNIKVGWKNSLKSGENSEKISKEMIQDVIKALSTTREALTSAEHTERQAKALLDVAFEDTEKAKKYLADENALVLSENGKAKLENADWESTIYATSRAVNSVRRALANAGMGVTAAYESGGALLSMQDLESSLAKLQGGSTTPIQKAVVAAEAAKYAEIAKNVTIKSSETANSTFFEAEDKMKKMIIYAKGKEKMANMRSKDAGKKQDDILKDLRDMLRQVVLLDNLARQVNQNATLGLDSAVKAKEHVKEAQAAAEATSSNELFVTNVEAETKQIEKYEDQAGKTAAEGGEQARKASAATIGDINVAKEKAHDGALTNSEAQIASETGPDTVSAENQGVASSADAKEHLEKAKKMAKFTLNVCGKMHNETMMNAIAKIHCQESLNEAIEWVKIAAFYRQKTAEARAGMAELRVQCEEKLAEMENMIKAAQTPHIEPRKPRDDEDEENGGKTEDEDGDVKSKESADKVEDATNDAAKTEEEALNKPALAGSGIVLLLLIGGGGAYYYYEAYYNKDEWAEEEEDTREHF